MNPIAAVASAVGNAYGKRQERMGREAYFKAELAQAKHQSELKKIEAGTERFITLNNNDLIADQEAQRAQKGSFKDEYIFVLATAPAAVSTFGAFYSLYCAAQGLPETIDFQAIARGMVTAVFGDLAWLYPILYAAMVIRLLGLARAFRMIFSLVRGKNNPAKTLDSPTKAQ